MPKMITRLQRLEAIGRQQEDARFERWLRSLSDEQLTRYITDRIEAQLKSLETLSNAQLIRLYHGELLSSVLSQ
jgi:hypothetical protein